MEERSGDLLRDAVAPAMLTATIVAITSFFFIGLSK
jgi:hypothetical protein